MQIFGAQQTLWWDRGHFCGRQTMRDRWCYSSTLCPTLRPFIAGSLRRLEALGTATSMPIKLLAPSAFMQIDLRWREIKAAHFYNSPSGSVWCVPTRLAQFTLSHVDLLGATKGFWLAFFGLILGFAHCKVIMDKLLVVWSLLITLNTSAFKAMFDFGKKKPNEKSIVDKLVRVFWIFSLFIKMG